MNTLPRCHGGDQGLRTPWRAILGLLLRVVVLAAISGCTATQRPPPPNAASGFIDLSGWNFEEHGSVRLDGQWGFFWNELRGPDDIAWDPLQAEGRALRDIPSGFSSYEEIGEARVAAGFATYVLTLRLQPGQLYAIKSKNMMTAHRIWVDDSLLFSHGRVATNAQDAIPRLGTRIGVFQAEQADVRMVLQVSNFDHRSGGPNEPIILGTYDGVFPAYHYQIGVQFLLSGFLLFMGIYHAIWFVNKRTEWAVLTFAVFCSFTAIRMAATNDKILLNILPLDYVATLRLEYVSFFLTFPLFLIFLKLQFPQEVPKAAVWLFSVVSAGYALFSLMVPPAIASQSIPSYQLVAVAELCLLLWVLLLTVKRGRVGARIMLGGFVLIATAVINDMLYSRSEHYHGGWAPLAVSIFVLTQAYILSYRFSKSFEKTESLSRSLAASNMDLRLTNEAVRRFVPFEFTSLLKRASIREVQRGDSVDIGLEILFCDIRKFTTIAEGLSADETFALINDWLEKMEPIIRQHKGFVNQYLGDCIMALYVGGADEAVRSGIGMIRALDELNAGFATQNRQPLRIGLGINSGPVRLGTIGGMQRLDSGVVGDPVNVAARVETMTKQYRTPMLISEATYQRLADPAAFQLRELDYLMAMGKHQAIRIYEVVDSLPLIEQAGRESTMSRFAEGLCAYRAGDFVAAKRAFEHCARVAPSDGPAHLYLDRCATFIEQPPAVWEGISMLESK